MKLGLSYGNRKLPKTTMIINMGTSADCPSRVLGMCIPVNDGTRCYADKAEALYPAVSPYRERQREYWRNTTKEVILSDIAKRIKNRRTDTTHLRFNEAGDFWDQEDVDKLSYIAAGLKTMGITTYGYTARHDLEFSKSNFIFKGSGYRIEGSTGKTIVIGKNDTVPRGFIKCPGNCKRCTLCYQDIQIDIAFKKH